jgi:hypothetical protein
MKHSTFVISRFENRNSVTSWRVDGRLHGLRIRRNFKTREEAAAEKAALELRAMQVASGMRSATTFLTDAQLREAEDAFRRTEGRSRSLLAYLDYALLNYPETAKEILLADAVADYLAAKWAESKRGLVSDRQVRSITYELNAFKEQFSRTPLGLISSGALVPYLERGSPTLKTYNNRRGVLSTFFKFAFRKDWVAANPVQKTPHHRIRHRRGSAITITAEQAAMGRVWPGCQGAGGFLQNRGQPCRAAGSPIHRIDELRPSVAGRMSPLA